MKRFLSLLVFILGVSLAFTSCTKEDGPSPYSSMKLAVEGDLKQIDITSDNATNIIFEGQEVIIIYAITTNVLFKNNSEEVVILKSAEQEFTIESGEAFNLKLVK